jgi:hypothetical protein
MSIVGSDFSSLSKEQIDNLSFQKLKNFVHFKLDYSKYTSNLIRNLLATSRSLKYLTLLGPCTVWNDSFAIKNLISPLVELVIGFSKVSFLSN